MSEVYNKSPKEVLKDFSSRLTGLKESEIEERRKQYGTHKVQRDERKHPFLLFLNQFKSGLIYILIISAAVSAAFHKWIDVYVIIAVVLIDAILGFVQEYKAEKAIDSLKNKIESTIKVFRDGELLKIPAEKLVPGDIVLLEQGDKIPADVRLVEVDNFQTRESILTEESTPVSKTSTRLSGEVELAERKNMAWMGTFVASGQARGIVVATGADTALRRMADIEKGGGHFEEKISTLSKQMAAFAFTGAALVLLISVLQKGLSYTDGFEAFEGTLLFSIATLISGVPEGLPAILVIVLAVGSTRMANNEAIIKRLPATETLGVVDHILTDKTGTLTKNTMRVEEIILADMKSVEVTGEGWSPKGEFYLEDRSISPFEDEDLSKLLHIAGICNQAQFSAQHSDSKNYEVVGNPTEGALVVLAKKAGLEKELITQGEKIVDDMPFDSEIKLRASLIGLENEKQAYSVGAPEVLLERSDKILLGGKKEQLTDEKREEMLEKIETMSDAAMRTIGFAFKEINQEEDRMAKNELEEMVFVGIAGMANPLRSEMEEAIEKAQKAGVRPVMITGDHKNTATTIAREVGIINENDDYPDSVDQSDLEQMSEVELRDTVKNVNVLARLTPHMKLKVAKILQDEKTTVAMTGDDPNDVPVVKQADIGIAMGQRGADVTKEASDIVLTNDSFASIVNAIEESRVVFENTRNATTFLVATNIAEITTLVAALLSGLPVPLLPTQILWLHLVTDGVMGAPLTMESGSKEILERSPRNEKEGILTFESIPYFLLMAGVMTGIAMFVFEMFYEAGLGLAKARAGAFSAMAFTQIFNGFNMRSLKKSIFEIGFFTNLYVVIGALIGIILQLGVIWFTPLRELFRFEMLTVRETALIFVLSSLTLWICELYKVVRYNLLRQE